LHAAAAAAPLLQAEAYLMRLYSAVAKRLPETEEWDLSGLQVDGQPVSRATVVAWLNAAYQHAYGTDFEEQDNSPACTAAGLYSLLAFADAVDSTKPLLAACCAGLEQLQLCAQLGQQQVALKMDGRGYTFLQDGRLAEPLDCSALVSLMPGIPVAADADQQAFKQQVAAQTEQLLWLGYRLQLEPLVKQLHGVVHTSCVFRNSLLTSSCDAVFSARVLEAAGVAGVPDGKQMLANSVVGEIAALGKTYHAVGTALDAEGLTEQQKAPLKFNAVVRHTGLLLQQGATVPVELDLFGTSKIKLGQQTCPVQLRIGHLFCEAGTSNT
jgi:hypothetical protein